MPRLLDSLPFFTGTGKKTHSRKGCPLHQLLELLPGQLPCVDPASHPPCSLRDHKGAPVVVKAQQILIWIALSSRDKTATPGNAFPVILDPGCTGTLAASAWHLENWARSPYFDPRNCRFKKLIREVVANTGSRTSPAPGNQPLTSFNQQLKQLRRPTLGDVLTLLENNGIEDHLALIEADLWLFANAPGERDELRGVDSWIRLRVPDIAVRPGRSLRPPLLGMAALQEGQLVTPAGTPSHLKSLEIDLEQSLVDLSYL